MQRTALTLAVSCVLLAACTGAVRKQEAATGALQREDFAPASEPAYEAAADAHAVAGAPEPAPPAAPPAPLQSAPTELDRIAVTGARVRGNAKALLYVQPGGAAPAAGFARPANTETYESRADNPVQRTRDQPVSTFSIDVDTGSYANVRRMLRGGVRPPADAVRAEEFINYFDYGHPAPATREVPFRVTTELAPAPWNAKRQLLMVGIKGYDVPRAQLPPANLVFLIDTSGSMDEPDKLPLVKDALRALVPQLRAQDRVSIVVYAGSAGLVLPPTPGDRHDQILGALDRLQAGGSTNGGEGIALAYAMAKRAFVRGGVNRVLLATDGDFNVGIVDRKALETLVGDQRKSGIALSTLGFGSGNYNDAMAERLADVGDGSHAYIDTPREARKVLVREMQSTLLTIARDVKIQVEFNPAQVAEYRLIGYENRVLRNEDFANDLVDAGDIGAGHQVTALYELTPVGSDAVQLPALRYGAPSPQAAASAKGGEVAQLRLRYKLPGAQASRLVETTIRAGQLRAQPGDAMRLAAAVAAYADALRGGTRMSGWRWGDIAAAARAGRGADPWGERAEFAELVDTARTLVDGDTADTPRVGVIAE